LEGGDAAPIVARNPIPCHTPPTERPPTDAADHAEDFARRYAEDLDIAVGQAMIDLGLTDFQSGARDP